MPHLVKGTHSSAHMAPLLRISTPSPPPHTPKIKGHLGKKKKKTLMIQKPADLLQIDKYESFLPRPSEKPEDFCDPINSSFL